LTSIKRKAKRLERRRMLLPRQLKKPMRRNIKPN